MNSIWYNGPMDNIVGSLTQLQKSLIVGSILGDGYVRIIPTHLVLDTMILAVWFMDDGSRCRGSDVYLNTQQFSYADQQKLIENLQQLGIEARMNKDKGYQRLRILRSSLPKFRNLIKDRIISSMQYKIEL